MNRRKLLLTLLDVLFVCVLGLYIFAGRDKVPFHGDESTQIALSRDWYILVYERDVQEVMYHEPAPGSWYSESQIQRILTGSINSLTIGMAWDVAGMTPGDLNSFWEWGISEQESSILAMWDWNVAHGNLPAGRLLRVSRTPSTLFTIFSVAVLFLIVWRTTESRPASWIAGLVYVTTPAVLVNGRRAMQEGAMLFFTALVILLALYAIEEQKHTPARWVALAGLCAGMGVASGFAAASKHTSAIIVAVAFLAVMFAPLARRNGGESMPFSWRHVCVVLGAGVLALAAFILLMPVWWSWAGIVILAVLSVLLLAVGVCESGWKIWLIDGIAVLTLAGVTVFAPAGWGDLIEMPAVIIKQRMWLVNTQAELVDRLDEPGERANMLLREAFFADTEYFEAWYWNEYEVITAQIDAYEDARLGGRGGGLLWGVALITLVAAGAWALIERGLDGVAILIGLWLLLPALGLLVMNVLPWQRYYLLLHAPVAAIIGVGVAHIQGKLRGLRRLAA